MRRAALLVVAALVGVALGADEYQAVDEFIEHEAKYDIANAHRSASGVELLGYVTPWNADGYGVAEKFAGKFKYLAPTWYIARPSSARGGFYYEVDGDHNVDADWMDRVRRAGAAHGRTPLFVPRVNLEGFSPENDSIKSLLSHSAKRTQLALLIVQKVTKFGFDGVTLDAGYLAAYFAPFASELGTRLHAQGKTLILVVPPTRGSFVPFDSDTFALLQGSVDRFSLMTYDYSSPMQPGPNAPIRWVEESARRIARSQEDRGQLLLGMNFYGNDYLDGTQRSSTVLGRDVVARLKNTRANRGARFEWQDVFKEHVLHYEDSSGVRHSLYYPTPASIQARIHLAKNMGAGIAIWELGQGLAHFLDLL